MHHESSGFPLLALLFIFVGTAAYVTCFVLAAQTGKLKPLDYVIGTLGLSCGLGWIYFLSRANTVTLQHSFDLVNQGADPSVARSLNSKFKMAAGAVIVCTILTVVFAR